MVAVARLVIASLFACSPEHERLDGYADVADELARGKLPLALAHVDAELAHIPESAASADAWRLRLLRAEILLTDGKILDAAPAIDARLPGGPEFAPLFARQLVLRGRMQIALGHRVEALTSLTEAERLALAASAGDVALDAAISRGRALLQTGRWPEGDATLLSVVARASSAGDTRREAMALNNLGMGRLQRNRYDDALIYFERVLAKTRIESDLVYAHTLQNAGNCYAHLGELDKGIELQRRAIAAFERGGGRANLERALGTLGNTHVQRGETALALPNYLRAYQVAIEIDLRGDAALWAGNLASAYGSLAAWDAAQRWNDEAKRLTEPKDVIQSAFNFLIDADIALGNSDTARARLLYLAAIASASDLPGVVWSAHAGLGRVALAGHEAAPAQREFDATLEDIERARSGLGSLDFKLSYLESLIGFYREYVDVLMNDGQTERAMEIADSSRARVLLARAASETKPTTPSNAELQKAARATGTVFLSYWLGPTRSYAWLVEPGGSHAITLPPAGTIAELVRAHQRFIVEGAGDPLASAGTAGDKLYQILVEPLTRWLPAGTSIVLVPDGALHALNFETLPVAAPARRFWIEDVTLAIAPSLAAVTAAPPSHAAPAPALLLVGDATAGEAGFPPLRFAAEEIARIAAHFPPAAVTTLARAEATPDGYLAAQSERYSIVHFAAHAAANRETPLDSSIVLSRGKDGSRLYARQVADRPLGADLVTISACRGAGERRYSGEGLIGFAWAFLRAGAHRVIAGLWDVDDRSTVELMDRLYAELAAARPAAAALRTAKLALIHRADSWRKPYYWAPFELFTLAPDREP